MPGSSRGRLAQMAAAAAAAKGKGTPTKTMKEWQRDMKKRKLFVSMERRLTSPTTKKKKTTTTPPPAPLVRNASFGRLVTTPTKNKAVTTPPRPALVRDVSFRQLVTREDTVQNGPQGGPQQQEERVYTPSKVKPKSPLSAYKVGKRQKLASSPSSSRRLVLHAPSTPELSGRGGGEGGLQVQRYRERDPRAGHPVEKEPTEEALFERPATPPRPGGGGGAGLRNMGNTCYMNAVLSVVLRSPAFVDAMRKTETPRPSSVLGSLQSLEDEIKRPVFGGLRPSQDLCLLGGDRRQEDANEYFLKLLDAVEKDKADPDPTQAFGGELEHTFVCKGCGHSTSAREEFKHISLSFAHRGDGAATTSASVQSLLDQYLSDEVVVKDCEHCKEANISHHLRKTLVRAPALMAVHLKRLVAVARDGRVELQKMTQAVITSPSLRLQIGKATRAPGQEGSGVMEETPKKGAPGPSLAPETPGEDQEAPLGPPSAAPTNGREACDLYGAIHHLGHRASSGHYISSVRQNGNWFTYNDEAVTQNLDRTVVGPSTSSFMLFYSLRT